MAPPKGDPAASWSDPLYYASLQLRIVAFILDVLVLVSVGALFAAAAGAYLVVDSNYNDGDISDRAPYVALAIFAVFLFVFIPLYHVLLWAWRGQTVGKMAVRLRVVTYDGDPISVWRAALRLIGYPASVLPLFMGIVIALFDEEGRTLHDRLAQTVVVEMP